jgi:hypothetical protein
MLNLTSHHVVPIGCRAAFHLRPDVGALASAAASRGSRRLHYQSGAGLLGNPSNFGNSLPISRWLRIDAVDKGNSVENGM